MFRPPNARAILLWTMMAFVFGMTASQTAAQNDVFRSIRAQLSDAAERSLATTLADQPWMKGSEAVLDNQGSFEPSTTSVSRLRAAIERVNRLRPTMEPVLREQGVPVELSAIVLVESGGLSTALSSKGARGVWQLMPDTARRYGLVVDLTRDDRSDVEKATRAAAQYLKDLYAEFPDWSLTLAAYNAGERAVGAALYRSKARDFRAISDKGLLPLETRNYVPAVFAAMDRLNGAKVLSVGQRETRARQVVYASSDSH